MSKVYPKKYLKHAGICFSLMVFGILFNAGASKKFQSTMNEAQDAFAQQSLTEIDRVRFSSSLNHSLAVSNISMGLFCLGLVGSIGILSAYSFGLYDKKKRRED